MGFIADMIQKAKDGIGRSNVTLPFATNISIGNEKKYGKPRPDDYNLQIKQFKSWVYACVQKNAYSVAAVKARVYSQVQGEKGIDLEEITEHPFLELMKHVNPHMNNFELKVITMTFLDLTGNAYWWIPKGQLGIPAVIWSIPSNWVKIVPSATKFIEGYVVRPPNTGKDIPFEEEEIIHFKYPSPFNLFYGTSPTLAAAYSIDLNNEINTYGINFFMNNAQPAGVLSTENGLTAENYERLRSAWNKRYKGSGNAGKMAILEKGLTYQKIGSMMKETSFKDTTTAIRNEILAIFGVPASKLGLVEDVNRANADANDYTYQKETVVPRLKLIEEKLNEKLMPLYDEGIIVQFDNPVPEDKEFRLTQQREHLASGYSSIDEERVIDGLEELGLPETEVPLISFSLKPAGEVAEEPDTVNPNAPVKPDVEDEEEDDKKSKGLQKSTRRKRIWEHFNAIATPQEVHFRREVDRYFVELFNEVEKNLGKFKGFNPRVKEDDEGLEGMIMFNMNEQNQKLTALSQPFIKQAFESGIALTSSELGINFDLVPPRIDRIVQARIAGFAEPINKYTAKMIGDIVQSGGTIEDISRGLMNIKAFASQVRADRIARTEVLGSITQGQFEAYRDSGVTHKTWISARDNRVRPQHQTHSGLDGQTVPMEQEFIAPDGTKLLYPRDPKGALSQIINCRCTIVAKQVREG